MDEPDQTRQLNPQQPEKAEEPEHKMAENLSPADLAEMIEKFTSFLILDCRSFIDYNTCHICSAQNIHFPSIVKRRSGGHISLEHIIRCPMTRGLLEKGHLDKVVLYDDISASVEDVTEDSNIYLVMKTLMETVGIRPYFLAGTSSQSSRHDGISLRMCPHSIER